MNAVKVANNKDQVTRGIKINKIPEQSESKNIIKKVGLNGKNSKNKNKPTNYFQMNTPVMIPGTLGHHVNKDMPEESEMVSKVSEHQGYWKGHHHQVYNRIENSCQEAPVLYKLYSYLQSGGILWKGGTYECADCDLDWREHQVQTQQQRTTQGDPS